MTVLLRDNRRWLGRLLIVALVLMGLPAGASWQCTDGTLCPPGHPFARAARSEAAPAGASAKHACCPGFRAPAPSRASGPDTGSVQAGSACVLSVHAHPGTQALTPVYAPHPDAPAALPVPAPEPAEAAPAPRTFAWSPPAPPGCVCFSLSSRAPPATA